MFSNYSFPVSHRGGFSTYLRIRFYLNRSPSNGELTILMNAAEDWYYKCINGGYDFGKQTLWSFTRSLVPNVNVFEVRVDIAASAPFVLKELFSLMDTRLRVARENDLFPEFFYLSDRYLARDLVRINRADIAYCNIDS